MQSLSCYIWDGHEDDHFIKSTVKCRFLYKSYRIPIRIRNLGKKNSYCLDKYVAATLLILNNHFMCFIFRIIDLP